MYDVGLYMHVSKATSEKWINDNIENYLNTFSNYIIYNYSKTLIDMKLTCPKHIYIQKFLAKFLN